MTTDTPRNGPALRLLRIHAGLTQAHLAERSGVSRKTISAYERGSEPDPETLAKLLRALELPVQAWAETAMLLERLQWLRRVRAQLDSHADDPGSPRSIYEELLDIAKRADQNEEQFLTRLLQLATKAIEARPPDKET
jgi:transcriptional regulator with XRE-family HTH domain